MALFALLSASGGDAFVTAAAPGGSGSQLRTPRLNAPISMDMRQQLPRRAVLAAGLLGLASARPAFLDEQWEPLSLRSIVERDSGLHEPWLQDSGMNKADTGSATWQNKDQWATRTKQIQGLRHGRKELSQQQVQKVKSVFDLFDRGSGVVKAEEIKGALRALNYPEDDIEKVMQQVIQTVSERGGYPEDFVAEDFEEVISGFRNRKQVELEQIRRWNMRADMMKAATGQEMYGKITMPRGSEDPARASARWERHRQRQRMRQRQRQREVVRQSMQNLG